MKAISLAHTEWTNEELSCYSTRPTHQPGRHAACRRRDQDPAQPYRLRQGKGVQRSTIASRLRTDEFDIDVVAQLDLPLSIMPEKALDLLYTVIRGEPGSRYYRMAKRRTWCVTVDYSDEMHLDVTPMLRRAGTPERESDLFHHRPEAPREPAEAFRAGARMTHTGRSRATSRRSDESCSGSGLGRRVK